MKVTKIGKKQKQLIKALQVEGTIFDYKYMKVKLSNGLLGDEHYDRPTVRGLVAKGLMVDNGHRWLTLTEAGKSLVLEEGDGGR